MATTRKLAQFITELQYTDIPDFVVQKAKEIVINSWGSQLACSTLPWSKLAYRYVRNEGGAKQSTVTNYGIQTSVGNAAFVNGCFAHGFEVDDNHGRAGVKGGCIVVPTALAVGEQQLKSGKEFLTALIAGYEVMIRAALAAHKGIRIRGHHPTAAVGAIGAATVAGKLLEMDEAALSQALAIASGQMVGLAFSEADTSGDRGYLKRTYGGMANFAGIRSALLANAGLSGMDNVLDVGSGFCRSFDINEADEAAFTNGLGSEWEIMDAHFKIYAQDGFIQPISQALGEIPAAHDFNVEDVEKVVAGTNKFAHDEIIGVIREPNDLTDAQWSANYSIALYLLKGDAGFHEYTQENLHDPVIRELSQRSFLVVDDEIEAEYQRTRPRGAKVSVFMKSGEEFKAQVDHLHLMTADELDAKFRKLSTVVLSETRSERLLDIAHHLEEVRDVSTLAPMLVR